MGQQAMPVQSCKQVALCFIPARWRVDLLSYSDSLLMLMRGFVSAPDP